MEKGLWKSLVVLVVLAIATGSCLGQYLYGDASLDYGSDFGIYRIPVNGDESVKPEVVYSIDYDYSGLGYRGGCVDKYNKMGYLLFASGDEDTVVQSVDLLNNNHASATNSTPFKLCYERTQSTVLTAQCVLNPVDNSSAILTGCYENDVTTLYLVDPVSGNISTVVELPVKLEYNPGSIAYDPVGANVYIPIEYNTWHSQTLLLIVNLKDATVESNYFPKGYIIREVAFDTANQRIVGLNQTYHFIGPIATDPITHVAAINAGNFNISHQIGDKVELPLLIEGASAVSDDGTFYFHAASSFLGDKQMSFDGIINWSLTNGNRTFTTIQDTLQPLTFLTYVQI